ncbi:Alpha/Beta hydrolase protein [Jimgerdemannia flammicorona]|uniref:Alpha/Beta hydrolase protein n=1 Tax=Jimgerdemannia flammicorona TaxID=994334 RepID=A0A433QJ37_9FUNG|nr:Alpha/Beta hydrolase protein [Jimgerdemannia flammicorona]
MAPLKFLTFFIAVLAAAQLITAAPSRNAPKGHKKHNHKPVSGADAVQTGEPTGIQLPKNTPQANGLATNWTYSPRTSGPKSFISDGSPDSTAFVSTLQTYARLASLAYCDFKSAFTCRSYCDMFPGITLIKAFNTPNTTTAGYIARDDSSKTIYLAYRGSQSLMSFIQDSQITYSNYPAAPGTRVHTGFLQSFQDARDIVYNTVVDEMNNHPGYTLYLVGHSLGGAEAVLQTLDFAQNAGYNSSNMMTYTFGQPRVGDAAFSSYVNSLSLNFIRSINQNDIVPHLPPLPLGFVHHVGEHWTENPKGDVVSNSQIPPAKLIKSVL